ncbi:MAG: phosphonate ABC transporter ATP-binding protein [Bacteroidetes bacterium GWF2_29_10]|nr:MAG: phosphonate ABC transporter ATP-binding protein [Bacteroidetes bacterium GWF2_29_10]
MEEYLIEINNADIYQNKMMVLSEVNFNVKRGEFIYLIGKNGSGKSSLLKTLYADIPLKVGEIKIENYNLKEIKKREIPYLRRKLGIVFQDFQLLMDRTVNDNLNFVMKCTGWKDKSKMKDKLEEVLTKVGLQTKGFKMPNQLSGGEQQRLSIGRALINDPHIILADEPTGNLDPETSEGIVQLLKDISQSGRVVLMATHDYSLFTKFPSKTFRCEYGKVITE